MPRPPEPSELTFWLEHTTKPECCHTCANYSADGRCDVYDMIPPADFAADYGACESWVDADPIPF